MGSNLNSTFKMEFISQNLPQTIEAYVTFLHSVPFPPVVQFRDANTKKKVIAMLFYLKLKDSRYIEKITIQTATLDFFKTSLIMFPTTGTN